MGGGTIRPSALRSTSAGALLDTRATADTSTARAGINTCRPLCARFPLRRTTKKGGPNGSLRYELKYAANSDTRLVLASEYIDKWTAAINTRLASLAQASQRKVGGGDGGVARAPGTTRGFLGPNGRRARFAGQSEVQVWKAFSPVAPATDHLPCHPPLPCSITMACASPPGPKSRGLTSRSWLAPRPSPLWAATSAGRWV